MIHIHRIDHVCLRVESLDEASPRWAIQFGLTEKAREGGRAYLACDYEPYTLELVEGGEPGHDHNAFELGPDCTLADAAEHVAAFGIDVREDENSIFLADADGRSIELVAYRGPERAWAVAEQTTATVPGFHPRKLGHVAIGTGAFEEQTRFYRDVLGMRVSDRLADAGIWFHFNPDHHGQAVLNIGASAFHHLALDIGDWGMMRVALDHVAQHGRWLSWGPVRHALGMNISSYVRIPEERCFVELYCDMEQLRPDHQPRTFPDNRWASNLWGQLYPRSWLRFDEAAIESERESLEARGIPLPPLPEPSEQALAAAARATES